MNQPRAIPMHPELPHLTHLSYYLIGGGQPKGRVELFHPTRGVSPLQQASNIILQALSQAKQQHKTANA